LLSCTSSSTALRTEPSAHDALDPGGLCVVLWLVSPQHCCHVAADGLYVYLCLNNPACVPPPARHMQSCVFLLWPIEQLGAPGYQLHCCGDAAVSVAVRPARSACDSDSCKLLQLQLQLPGQIPLHRVYALLCLLTANSWPTAQRNRQAECDSVSDVQAQLLTNQ